VAPPGAPPNAESFYVPGHWIWNGDRYVWRAGYWARVQPGYVWVPSHYRWTPYGYVYIAGYWDLAVARRGILYAPVVVDTVIVGPRFVYTPAYAVSDTVVLDAMFVRPACCHYYYGDYYGERYRERGYVTCVVYSRTHYEPIIVYRTWEYRDNPRWLEVQIRVSDDRHYGRAAPPPRNIVQINNYYNTTVVAPTAQVAQARGVRTVAVPPAARQQMVTETRARHVAAVEARREAERPVPGRPLTAPRTAALKLPPSQPTGTPVHASKAVGAAPQTQQHPVVRPNPQQSGGVHAPQPAPKAGPVAPGPHPAPKGPPATKSGQQPPRPQPKQQQQQKGKQPPDDKKN
jgi:hypothetical protein